MLDEKSRVHFVGAGGIGMSALALLLTQLGHTVSGSDLKASGQTRKLQEAGAQIFIGPHRPQNVRHPGLVVVSSAIAPDNPEVLEAKSRRIAIIHRSDLLAELMRTRKGIAVAGSHGKTTTAAMIAALLIDTGFDPTCLIGGVVTQLASNARLGHSEYLVAETDESDRSFLKLQPKMVVITNIDLEHMVSYPSEADLMAAFEKFAKKVDGSRCVLCKEDSRVRRILPGIGGKPITYGFQEQSQLVAERIHHRFGSSNFRVLREGKFWGEIQLNISGIHNVLNSLAVIGISILLEIPSDKTIQSLARFRGVARRLEKKGSAGGVDFYDDYGHHPTEIRVTLAAAKESGRRVVTIFQPHRYTRTRDSFEAFKRCFGDADVLFVLDIYSAGEPRLEGINSERLAKEISRAGHPSARFVEGHAVVGEVCNILRQGDLMLTIGAGNVDLVGETVMRQWEQQNG